PPTSTLFPYTTLFRSGFDGRDFLRGSHPFLCPLSNGHHFGCLHCIQKRGHFGPGNPVSCGIFKSILEFEINFLPSQKLEDDAEPDRKSTRLNSSHVKI